MIMPPSYRQSGARFDVVTSDHRPELDLEDMPQQQGVRDVRHLCSCRNRAASIGSEGGGTGHHC